MYPQNKHPKLIFKIVSFAIYIIFLSSCVPGLDNKSSLTDEKVRNYINVYKNLREKAPEILQSLNASENNVENGKTRA